MPPALWVSLHGWERMDQEGCDTRRIPDDHISQRRYPWFVALYVMYRAIEQLIQETQGSPST